VTLVQPPLCSWHREASAFCGDGSHELAAEGRHATRRLSRDGGAKPKVGAERLQVSCSSLESGFEAHRATIHEEAVPGDGQRWALSSATTYLACDFVQTFDLLFRRFSSCSFSI